MAYLRTCHNYLKYLTVLHYSISLDASYFCQNPGCWNIQWMRPTRIRARVQVTGWKCPSFTWCTSWSSPSSSSTSLWLLSSSLSRSKETKWWRNIAWKRMRWGHIKWMGFKLNDQFSSGAGNLWHAVPTVARRRIIAGTWAIGKTACWRTFWCSNVS